MPPTLASLVHHSALKLTVRAGEDRLDVPVRWAHVSELADPVPYMEGGELLLITALKLDAEDPEVMRRYVKRLAGAGVVGLGFAVGVNYEEIPEALVDAADKEGLPLLEVPRRTPFLAISKAVSAAIAADQYRAVTAGFAAQRELTKQALGGGAEGLLTALAGQVDGWDGCCTTPRAPSSPPHPSGRADGPPGSPRTWSGCGSGRRPRARWSARPTTRTASSCTRSAPAAGRAPRSPSARPPPSAPPSGTPCTPRSPCSR
ncbi:putative regulatory protein [Streptomyces avermitilis MA-4680 = NBRC 14893]|uniref:Regulatory protein n=1 Tax=Streptomyces avermitilis (strain ATCC 31267 / DSM 46492 / JCM 5070 / NBRC 14893 / NCIMB 12804 / NRRL 8165 / MA-4680) TaxID=227882 RepID=Q82K23_STRAW|nr:putative regulatory protein [Streptomyces avermitilis MA-4680 = NBRC 14893]